MSLVRFDCNDYSAPTELERAPILLMGVEPARLVGSTLHWVYSLVNKRYCDRRCTVVLCPLDPVAAYESRFPGQDEGTMPRLVGRILELGDAVEVAEDGAYCVEFVFSEKAATDYVLLRSAARWSRPGSRGARWARPGSSVASPVWAGRTAPGR